MIRVLAAMAMTCICTVAFASSRFNGRIGFDPVPGSQVPLAEPLQDESGRTRTLGEWLGGKAGALAPVYFDCPNLCDLTLAGMATSLADDRSPVLVLSIDPAATLQSLHDARSRLQSSVHAASVQRWRLLRADAASIERITGAIGFRYFYDEQQRQFAHAAGFVVLDPSGRVASSFTGVRYDPDKLRSALAAAERGESTVGQRLLLTCFDYDPATGSYSLRIVKLMRVMGVLAAAALGGGIAWALLRERSKRQRSRPGASP